jgi:hypothetical protein
MTMEKWQKIVGQIMDNFEVIEHEKWHEEEEGGADIERIVFNGPLGKMKLEFIMRPAILDKKTTYSRRIGSETKVDYVYSPTEKTYKMIAFKWDDSQDDWVEMDGKMFT